MKYLHNEEAFMNYKKYMGVALTTSLLFGSIIPAAPVNADTVTASSTGLKDLNTAPWATKFITKMHIRNIVKGYEDGTFQPLKQVNQVEALTMVINYLGYSDEAEQYRQLEVTEDKVEILKDVPDWGRGYVLAAIDLNLIDIDSTAGFKSNDPATRAWIVNMLVKAVKIHGTITEQMKVSFSDESSIPDWAYDSIMEAANAEILKGYEDGTFKAGNTVTRAEMTAFMYNAERYLKAEVQKDIISGTVETRYEDAILINLGDDKFVKKYFNDNVPAFYGSEVITSSQLKVGDKISAVMKGEDSLIFIDVLEGPKRTEASIEGEVYLIDATRNIMTIEDAKGLLLTYKLDSATTAKQDGNVIAIKDVKMNDKVGLVVKDDVVQTIEIVEAFENENIVEVVSVNVELKALTVRKANSELAVYEITNTMKIVDQEGNAESFDSIAVKDKLTLVYESDKLVSVKLAKYELENSEIKTIQTSSRTVGLQVEGSTVSFALSTDVKVKIDGFANAGISDLVRGDKVNAIIKEGKVVDIEVLNRKRAYYIYQSVDTSATSIKVQSMEDNQYYYLKYLDIIKPFRDGQVLSSFSSLALGDRIEVSFSEDDLIIRVDAASMKNGRITEINVENHWMRIKDSSNIDKYVTFPDDVLVKINNVTTTIDKLQVNDYIRYYSINDNLVEINK